MPSDHDRDGDTLAFLKALRDAFAAHTGVHVEHPAEKRQREADTAAAAEAAKPKDAAPVAVESKEVKRERLARELAALDD